MFMSSVVYATIGKRCVDHHQFLYENSNLRFRKISNEIINSAHCECIIKVNKLSLLDYQFDCY